MSSRYILAFLKSPGFHLTDQFSFALLAAFNCRIAPNAFEGSAIVSFTQLFSQFSRGGRDAVIVLLRRHWMEVFYQPWHAQCFISRLLYGCRASCRIANHHLQPPCPFLWLCYSVTLRRLILADCALISAAEQQRQSLCICVCACRQCWLSLFFTFNNMQMHARCLLSFGCIFNWFSFHFKHLWR